MNKKILVSLCIYIAGAVSLSANAAVVQGIGATTCSEFLASVRSGNLTQSDYFAWAQGYLSRLNSEQETYGRIPLNSLNPASFDIGAQKGYIWNYCNNNPRSSYENAVIGVWNVLVSRSSAIS